MKKTKLLVVSTFFLCTSWAHASVLYDESISGDLAGFDTRIFNLSSGINSVLGSVAFNDLIVDFDSFNLSLGGGLRLNSIDYFISNVSISSNTNSLETGYALTSGNRLLDGTNTINILGSSQQSMFGSALPLIGNLELGFDHIFLGRGGEGGTWNYEIRFTISPVPEPTMCMLMLMGLGLLGFHLVAKKSK